MSVHGGTVDRVPWAKLVAAAVGAWLKWRRTRPTGRHAWRGGRHARRRREGGDDDDDPPADRPRRVVATMTTMTRRLTDLDGWRYLLVVVALAGAVATLTAVAAALVLRGLGVF